MASCDLTGAKFIKTKMQGVKLEIQPDLLGHTDNILCVRFSPNGN